MRNIFIAGIIMLFTIPVIILNAQENKSVNPISLEYKIITKSGGVKIPFEMYRNKIRMKATINNKECFLTMDNGSLWDEILFFGSTKTDSLGLLKTGESFIGDSTSANAVKVDLTGGFTLNFGDIVFSNQKGVVTHYVKGQPNLWEGIDGQVSATFFRHFLVEVNYDSSFVRLIKPDNYKLGEDWQELKMKVSSFDSRTINAIVSTSDGREIGVDLLIDFGGIHPLYLPIGKDERITLPSNAIEASIGMGAWGTKNGHFGRVRSIRFGKFTLDNVITAFVPADKNSDAFGTTMIGMPLLMRFNVFFDYPNERIILQPSSRLALPFKFNMTGFVYLPDRQGNIKVTEVYAGSQAFLNGIKAGDIITKVNDKKISSYTPVQLRELFMKEADSVKLFLERDLKTFEITIILKQVI